MGATAVSCCRQFTFDELSRFFEQRGYFVTRLECRAPTDWKQDQVGFHGPAKNGERALLVRLKEI